MATNIVNLNGTPAGAPAVIVSPTGEVVSTKTPAAPIHPFPDGYIFKMAENPNRNSKTFVLHTVDGRILGVVQDPAVAEMICEACKLLHLAGVVQQEADARDNMKKSDRVTA